jgi:hypothetical protein
VNSFFQTCTVAFLAASLGYAGQGLGAYIDVVERIAKVETRLEAQDRKIDQIIEILVQHGKEARPSK